jgi:hypothetical protein
MLKSAHQAAIDQAQLLAAYLHATPSGALDMHFIRRHLDALREFAQAAVTDNAPVWEASHQAAQHETPPSAN